MLWQKRGRLLEVVEQFEILAVAKVPMQSLLLILAFIFLGIVAPVFLIAMASPWSFASILTGWTVFAAIVTVPLRMVLRSRNPKKL